MHNTGKFRVLNRASVAFFAAILVSGCATTNSSQSRNASANWLFAGHSITWLSAEQAMQLEHTPVGSTLALGHTSWGKQTRFVRTRAYFSATGAQCFKSTITTSNQPAFAANVCKYPHGYWGISKALQPLNVSHQTSRGSES